MILGGFGSFKVDDEVFPVAARDAVYCQPSAMRGWEAGADGLEMLAFGAHAQNDSEMQAGWWTD